MSRDRIEKIVIAGGGIAGWAAAACIIDSLRGQLIEIVLLDDQADLLSSIETSLPIMHTFNQRLGFNEQALMRSTAASFSLGTKFTDWPEAGHNYFQPMAPHGASIEFVMFHQYAIKARLNGDKTPFNHYSLCAMAAQNGKFAHPGMDPESILSTLLYSHHLNSALYMKVLTDYAKTNGVSSFDADVVGAEQHPDTGFITSVTTSSGEVFSADLFIDCGGDRSVLAGVIDNSDYEDWGEYLPANRVISLSDNQTNPLPCSQVTGLESGWYQSLSTQQEQEHRLVFCDRHLDDESATRALLDVSGFCAEGAALSFRSGHLKSPWFGNCIALGGAAGSVEPLGGTSLATVQSGLLRLMQMFPDKNCDPLLSTEYNRRTTAEYQNIRDFLVLHYRASKRTDSPFWREYLKQDVPDSLAHKIKLFQAQGQVAFYEEESFPDPNWASVWLGQDQWPASYDPMLDNYDFERLKTRFDQMKQMISQAADAMPAHEVFLQQYCPADPH